MALTDTALRNAKPTDKAFKLYDEKGLFLIVNPNGGKWWRFKYRFNEQEKTLSLGTYPEIKLAGARVRRDEARELVANGINPSDTRKAEKTSTKSKASNSFEVIAREWVQTFFVTKSESHKERTLRRLEVYIFPWLGGKPITEITAPEVLQVTGQILRYAVQTGRVIRDVTTDLRGALPPAETKHMAAFTEPKEVAELLREIGRASCRERVCVPV